MGNRVCPQCGQEYSDTYRKCPFCEEEEAEKRGKPLRRRAASGSPAASAAPAPAASCCWSPPW